MELKKFKDFRKFSGLLESHSSNGSCVEVKKTNGLFAVSIDGIDVETFRTKAAADEAAKDAIEAMENK